MVLFQRVFGEVWLVLTDMAVFLTCVIFNFHLVFILLVAYGVFVFYNLVLLC